MRKEKYIKRYVKTCEYCMVQLSMVKGYKGSWIAYEVETGKRHRCEKLIQQRKEIRKVSKEEMSMVIGNTAIVLRLEKLESDMTRNASEIAGLRAKIITLEDEGRELRLKVLESKRLLDVLNQEIETQKQPF